MYCVLMSGHHGLPGEIDDRASGRRSDLAELPTATMVAADGDSLASVLRRRP
jgi:hypothetical protein